LNPFVIPVGYHGKADEKTSTGWRPTFIHRRLPEGRQCHAGPGTGV